VNIYLDNAATTKIDEEVVKVMTDCLINRYGNPSSIHSFGRKSRSLIECARRNIAEFIEASPRDIFFTSGGTEADNMAIRGAVRDAGIKNIITSQIEHPAVINTMSHLKRKNKANIHYVKLNALGELDMNHLEELLVNNKNTLVTLMHANNEIGNLISLEKVTKLCLKYKALFHSDTVQTIGHIPISVKDTPLDFLTCSAHKLHGPKGVGFLYIKDSVNISPLIHGGSQENNMRGGTEYLHGIVGLSKAMEIACKNMDIDKKHILNLKSRMICKLKESISGIFFNGQSADLENSLYTILSVSLPNQEYSDLLLFNLDLFGIACSGGSACSSGSSSPSHVISRLKDRENRINIRFSFSKYNTVEEIDYVVEKLSYLVSNKN
tara:strand:+ start:366 stop:1505 length:1140 start_codon:yes stop_codon:yes gene_type:complete